mmetsp:Transcript_12500/g.17990  ORF Transcript_12500/g.17990 Transcript_12500/m.17990 type:complete len:329 (-) Transcript_12500:1828-2814(-)
MGGDGGTIGNSRRFLRGAGSASTTADATRYSSKELIEHKQDYALQAMRNCSLTGAPLNFETGIHGTTNAIVACLYGRLYNRESVVEALLRRKQQQRSSGEEEDATLGGHIRGLKDLYAVRFHMQEQSSSVPDSSNAAGKNREKVPVCPVTGALLNGTHPAFLIVKLSGSLKQKKQTRKESDDDEQRPNVISERALKEIGIDALQLDFGPFRLEDVIRLAPPTYGSEWEKIQERVLIQQAEQRDGKKNGKKRQLTDTAINNCIPHTKKSTTKADNKLSTAKGSLVPSRAVELAKMNASSALSSSNVLSSLFVQKQTEMNRGTLTHATLK